MRLMARRPTWLLICSLVVVTVLSSYASAKVVEHTFTVANQEFKRLCHKNVLTVVNGQLPGPTIHVEEGDTLIVHVLNKSPYSMTIHWHGVTQYLSSWADGPEYVTQCPILPGKSFTYKFNVSNQEGTLWYHAHVSVLRATVYGALIIHPRRGRSFPFPRPHEEIPLLIGEYWDTNVVEVEDTSFASGGPPNVSDAYTFNGQPGALYPCSKKHTHRIKVQKGKLYLLRIINAAINNQQFFKIAKHKVTVVAIDATYTNPYVTDVVVIAPGQSVDVLLRADQSPGLYYFASKPYVTVRTVEFDNTTATGILEYENANPSIVPKMPTMPDNEDTPIAHKFYSILTGLVTGPFYGKVIKKVDVKMYVTFGFGLLPCDLPGNATCAGAFGMKISASMNNESFQLPSKTSLLEAFTKHKTKGVYTNDFPDQPPVKFDYTNLNNADNLKYLMTKRSTKVKALKFNQTVELVYQNTALISVENHPMHLHGFNIYVLAMGFGNFNPITDPKKYNLVNPQMRNTVAVPVGGWAAIRFRADNPGVWLLHCHMDFHVPVGMAMAFSVPNGGTPSTTLPPPPKDLPKC